MIVSWGPQLNAAFKSRKRHADGSMLRTSATATYVGLVTFAQVDGGTATVAGFTLAE